MRSQLTFILIIISLFLSTYLAAQRPDTGQPDMPSLKLKGQILDHAGQPLSFASVALHRMKDSSLIKGTATDLDGSFEFEVRRPRKFLLKISFLSYQDKWVVTQRMEEGQDLTLEAISLEMNENLATEVTVEGEKNIMELKLDKRVYNVNKDLDNRGKDAAEILDNIPSVAVDVDGNVSLRGSQGVRILIDGKPSGLTGLRTTDALRQLQGNMIEKIEVITNPSARYDAEGEVGIINIVLKKGKKKGINGTFTARVGWPEDFSAGFNLNFRHKVVNFFAGYNLIFRKRVGQGSVYQEFTNPDTSFIYESQRRHDRGGWGHNARLGTSFFMDKYNTLTISGTYSSGNNNNLTTMLYTDYDINNNPTRIVNRGDTEKEMSQNIDLNLNHTTKFKKKGQKWTFDLNWSDRIDNENSTIIEESDDVSFTDLTQRVDNQENSTQWLIQSDYIHPFAKEGKFETGVRATLRTIDNDYEVEQQNADQTWFTLNEFDNRMIYKENIYAAYVMAGSKWKSLSFQAGLRAEYSDVSTNLVETNEINPRQYLDFFPSAFLSYEFKKKHFLQASYSRRIKRPTFWSLIPFVGFNDSRNIWGGNPDLNPEYTHSNEITYLKYFNKGSITGSVYYRYSTDVNDRILIADSTGVTRRIPVNVGQRHSFGLEASGSYKPWKWWNINASFNFFRAILDGSYAGQDWDNDTYAWQGRLSSKWTIAKKLNLQASVRYRSPRKDPQGKILALYGVNFGASMDVLKGNGTLTLQVSDIFNTRIRRSIVFGEGLYTESSFQWQTRRFNLNFSYRLNQKKQRPRRGGGEGGGDF
ncbi:MAG: TonB-dependent receptor family protein [Saprospiraceae bacterium]|nr:TonB-dependent receptor family protein [Saprospiraceae bacterium]